jgi:hypothetical protein
MADKSTLEKVLLTIDLPVQYDLAVAMVSHALVIWEDFAKDPRALDYYDGVGNHFEITKDLPHRVVAAAREEIENPGSRTEVLMELYSEIDMHIVKINCFDWEPPDAINRVLCSCFNLLRLFVETESPKEPTINLVINQAADAMLSAKVKTLDELNQVLELAKTNYAKKPGNRADENKARRADGHPE